MKKMEDITLRQEVVFHISVLKFDGLIGYSPIAMARNIMKKRISLEPEAIAVCNENAIPPLIICLYSFSNSGEGKIGCDFLYSRCRVGFRKFSYPRKTGERAAARTGSVLIFPEYSRSPEVRYPVAIEQCYDVLCRVPEILSHFKLQMNERNLTVAGDSVGGNMAIIEKSLLIDYNQSG